MTLEISAQDRPTTHYVGIPVTARFSEFGAPNGPNEMIPRIYGWLAEHEIEPLGGPLYIYRRRGADGEEPVDLTVAVPVAEPLKTTSGLVPGSLPAGTYVVGRHIGAPDQTHLSQTEVRDWSAANGYRLRELTDDSGLPWTGFAEHFLTDPVNEPDASRWVIELLFKTS